MKAVCVPPDQSSVFLPLVEPFLKRSMERGGIGTYEDIVADISKGALIWIAWDGKRIVGVAVTWLSIINGTKILQILAFAGSKQCLSLLPDIYQYARNEQCIRIRVTGRKGWLREFKDYRLKAVVLEKELI